MVHSLFARWNRVSLRSKITGVTVLMLTVGLLASGVGTFTMLRSWVVDQSDKKLLAIAQGDLSAYFNFTDWSSATNDSAVFISLYNADGSFARANWSTTDSIEDPMVPASLTINQAYAKAGKVFPLRGSNGDDVFRAVTELVAVNDSTDYRPVVIAISVVDSERLLSAFLAIYLGLGVGIVILGGLLTRMLVTSTFGPLRRVEQTAARIADGDFSQRMTDETPNTEVGRLNRSLNVMLNRIDRAFKDRAHTIDQMRRFVGDASHELRTPLVSVRGYAELYRMGALQSPEEVASAMERIEKEAIRMSGLVEDLLELARLDEAKPLQMVPVDLVPLARDAALDANAADPDRSITLVAPLAGSGAPSEAVATSSATAAAASHTSKQAVAVSGQPSNNLTGPIALAGAAIARLRPRRRADTGAAPILAPSGAEASHPMVLAEANARDMAGLREHPFAEGVAVVNGEENRLRQIVSNMVGNAMRYTPAGSPIEIRVSVDDAAGQAELAVIDHGEGIPPQIRDKIFQRFWRADTSRARETGGSGLGLAIVASLVAAHHGSVDVVETPGGGATFRLRIPLLRGSKVPQNAIAPEPR